MDTSVFGGYFEPEFELWTKLLIDKIIKGEIKMLYSQLTEIELNQAPQYVKDLVNKSLTSILNSLQSLMKHRHWLTNM